jgi:GntR family transcriptional regulator / MocR family aminotransferase
LTDALRRHLGDLVRVEAPDAGMHLAVYLEGDLAAVGDVRLAEAAHEARIGVYALSRYFLGPPGAPGLLLGYAGVTEAVIESGIRRLADVARACARTGALL